jgi:hypothetical protein
MVEMFDRLDLSDLTAEQIAPLEALMAKEWSDTWRDLATSHYVTLLSAPGADAVLPIKLAQLAVALTLGIAQDLGGSQPYIPVGFIFAVSTKARNAIDMLRKGASYRDAAVATGLTESRVRQIELQWRRQQIELLQFKLDFS